jgi:hypothetical protein
MKYIVAYKYRNWNNAEEKVVFCKSLKKAKEIIKSFIDRTPAIFKLTLVEEGTSRGTK